MDRLTEISRELIRLYRQQLNFWVLGKVSRMNDIDILQYDRRKERIDDLRKQLETLTPSHR